MTFELWNSLATTATFLVVAAAAIAAIVQLRHMRSSNQILVLDSLLKESAVPEFAEAQHFVFTELSGILRDPAFRYQLVQRDARVPANQAFMTKAFLVGNFYNYMGELVKRCLLDAEIACEYWGQVTTAWDALLPIIAITRRSDPRIWENFEYVAVLVQDYVRAHPGGGYPRGVRRLTVNDDWIEADTEYAASIERRPEG